ncbi:alpha/beta fold hydrolase [Tengunoibacter tsumagoiensis]|uniref:Epoxide hydrolase n=1 Tax=Tengunoibacter tsumagoiensis TaxID=2014871 RepID=A0A402A0P6_9CHLR|nr:alpha/beta hydrolase [Tengunoibacter tsumagoiensis]GCE12684.1 epoxide hydrolase [Tengunoibacter tsumagoiensis]
MSQLPSTIAADEIESYVTHGYATNGEVKIHYASLGSGPLIIMVHGFPDFWYTWRHQMVALAPQYQTVALDLRGYNLSDKPQGQEQYAMPHLIGDIRAVIKALGKEQAIVVGHDWGGAISWQFALYYPTMLQKLIILNLPHPYGMAAELAHNPEQQANSQYARDFQREGAHLHVTSEALAAWVQDPEAHAKYLEAMQRSDREAQLHYYKANYPRPPYQEITTQLPKITVPVLQIHGLQDTFLLPGALNNTWNWMEQDYTLVTIPRAGHFVQHDAADLVTRTIKSWLAR